MPLLNYPRPKKGKNRWCVYAHSAERSSAFILDVVIDDVGDDMADVTVEEVIYSVNSPSSIGEAFEIPWKRHLPETAFEAKQLFIRARFEGVFM